MYIGFIVYVIIIAIIMGLIMSKKFRSFFTAVILFAMFVFGAFALQNAARAEEIRTAYIVEFDFSTGCFILEDEDGYLWAFELTFGEYHIGDEYTLHLSSDAEPYYE